MENIKPLSESIKAIQHEPEYTVHRYFARRPHNVINNIIKHYAPQKGALIFDPFGGGGTMLYESLVCNQRAIACDTSDLAAFIIEQEALMASADLDILSHFVDKLMANLAETFSLMYSFEGKEIYWIEWSSYTVCPKCGERVYLSPFNTIGAGKYTCLKCKTDFRPQRVSADSISPVEICCIENGSIRKGKPTGQERLKPSIEVLTNFYDRLCDEIKNIGMGNAMIPQTTIPDCNLQRESALHKKNFIYFEQFIPTATRGIIQYIGEYIMKSDLTDIQKRQMIFVLSASLRYCSRFSSLNQAWRGDRPMEWAKSNFWTPYTFVEVNPIITFYERWQSYVYASTNAKKKFDNYPRYGTCAEVVNGEKDFAVINASSESVEELPNESVDLIVTDPPYGSYLHYGELSAFWTTWLHKFIPEISAVPSRISEAVPARKKGYPGWKTFSEYEKLLTNIFCECYRVLKDNQYCVVTFNNKEPEAWVAFLRAVKRAGFLLPEKGIIFQDGVESYKKSIDSRRGGAIFGDFIYSFKKISTYTPSVFVQNKTWQDQLIQSLTTIAEQKEEISNVELYTNIYLDLLPELFKAIDVNTSNDNTYISDLTFNNFESTINQFYKYSDGVWYKK